MINKVKIKQIYSNQIKLDRFAVNSFYLKHRNELLSQK